MTLDRKKPPHPVLKPTVQEAAGDTLEEITKHLRFLQEAERQKLGETLQEIIDCSENGAIELRNL